jgi:hypothetical protein
MVKQDWKIDNKEKNRIIQLHEIATKNLYIIKEQIESKKTINFGDTFASGQSRLTSEFESSVSSKVQEIVEFIKGQKLKSVGIIIQPGESQVTNQPPFSTVGSLAIARANSIRDYLNKVLPKLLSFTPNITISRPIIGSTPYSKGDDRNDSRYRAEQFVNVIIDIDKSRDIERDSSVGEPIYLNNKVVALISKPFVSSKTVSNSGNLDINRETVTFKVVKPDTQPPVVLSQYSVPWQWWNEKIGPSSTISQENYDYIISNFKKN